MIACLFSAKHARLSEAPWRPCTGCTWNDPPVGACSAGPYRGVWVNHLAVAGSYILHKSKIFGLNTYYCRMYNHLDTRLQVLSFKYLLSSV
jgi:hypothetical protein